MQLLHQQHYTNILMEKGKVLDEMKWFDIAFGISHLLLEHIYTY